MSWNLSTRAGRLARMAALGLVSLSLVPATGVGAATGERPLDFGAAMLLPADVAPFGFEEYGIDSGRFFSLQQMLGEGSDVDPNDPEIEEIGMESVHNLMLHPIGGIEEHPGPDINITSFIFVYDDEEHAEEGFALFEDETGDPTATDLDDVPTLGDESELTEYREEYTEGGEEVELHSLDFSFRVGRVTAILSVVGFDEEVERDVVEEMAAALEAKVRGVLEEGRVDGRRTPGLDSIVPRYEADDVSSSRSHYCVLNGEALVQAYYPERTESTQEWADDYDVVADYCSLTRLWLTEGESADLHLTVEPARFAQADSAARYMADQVETASDPELEFEIIDIEPGDLPFEADAVLAVTYESDATGSPMQVTRLIVQQGRLVIDMRINGYSTPELDVLIAVMTDAIGCAGSACYETLEPPAELLDFVAEQGELLAEQ